MTTSGDAQRVEDRAFGDWIGYSAVATVASAAIILANPLYGFGRSAAAAAIVVALYPVYWFLARPSRSGLRSNSWRAWTYIAIAVVAYLGAIALTDWANVALFVLSPQIFLLLTFVPACTVIVVLNLGGLVVRLGVGEISVADLAGTAGITLLVIAMSIYFSNRITAVTKESKERGLLIDRLRLQQAEIAQLSEQQGAAAERERIAREMHDTLAQGFTSIVTLGHAVQAELETDPGAARRHIELMTLTAQENLQESRRIIAALTPGRLAEDSLDRALRRVTARFEDETGVPAAYTVTGEPRPAPPTVEVVALRVLQEALANVRKHAGARSVSVELAYEPGELRLQVADDGSGFDTAAPREGYGIDGMSARVREAGGRFELSARADVGTTLSATLPAPTAAATGAAATATPSTPPSPEEPLP
ncbi:sensor histidine kinase [Leifsonia sp. F6_8S_P_1B]|uniref:histidine kinase n=1 Tax=Leifsonia williamsii TaxID=3035919 RepID=A0ABT8K7K4_9MICO|nr:sensor histidine kinase [Leifsonia williamsii]MDN4613384.1 sensor histidine kinase [Leifsonia williamsii]